MLVDVVAHVALVVEDQVDVAPLGDLGDRVLCLVLAGDHDRSRFSLVELADEVEEVRLAGGSGDDLGFEAG